MWIDTSWLVLYNALRFEKMQKYFISEHTFYINSFTLLISSDPFLLMLEIIFEVLLMVLSVLKLKSLHVNKIVKKSLYQSLLVTLAMRFQSFLNFGQVKIIRYLLFTSSGQVKIVSFPNFGQTMYFFTWENNISSILYVLFLTKRKELNEISYIL